jgi:hypothetical protein
MKNTISITADLNLSTSLQQFQAQIERLLQIEEVSQWDGTTVQEREAQIRQSALELAGQCIALLLFQLSQSAEAHQVAQQRTNGQRQVGSQGHGNRRIEVVTVGNVVIPLTLPYVIQGKNSKVKGKRSGQVLSGGYYPFLSWLGMSERMSPFVWSTVAEYGMMSTSFSIGRGLLEEWGIHLSERRVERLTYRFGEIGLAHRQQQLEQLETGILARQDTLKGQRVVISVDGGRTRLRRSKRGARKHNSGRHGYYGDWREPLLLTIYAVDEEGQKINTTELPITNDGTFGHHHTCLQLLEMHLCRLGIQQCAQTLLVADGALWIWKEIPLLLERLGCGSHQVTQLLDFYHASEHLQTFAEIALASIAVKAWVKKAASALKRGSIHALIEKMQHLAQSLTGKRQQEALQTLQYFSKQPQRFNYAQVAAQKLPIGSGSIESLIRQVVNLRLKGNGKFWLPQHAEIMVHGRCQWIAKAWASFSDSVLTAHLSPI